MTYRDTLINEMIKSGIDNCEVEDFLPSRMDLIDNMAASLDYKYGDKLTMGPEAAKEVALDNFRKLCRYVDIIDGTIEIAFFDGLIDYVWKELLNVYKFEGITDEVLESIKEELYIVNMNELKNKVNELTNKCNELLNEPRTEENIELGKAYLKEIDILLANITVYNGEVEEVEG